MQQAAELVAEDEGWAGRIVPMEDVAVGATDAAGQNLHHAPTRTGPRHRRLNDLNGEAGRIASAASKSVSVDLYYAQHDSLMKRVDMLEKFQAKLLGLALMMPVIGWVIGHFLNK